MRGLRVLLFRRLTAGISACALILLSGFVVGAEPSREQVEFFEKKIRPVLVDQCYQCHAASAKKVKGGLLLDTLEGMRKGGVGGAALVPGDPGASVLVKALRYEDLKMPPDKKLPAAVIADFEKWIKDGAIDPRTSKASASSKSLKIEAGKQFWSFKQPIHHEPPLVHDSHWSRRKIDGFVLARLEEAGLKPSQEADRRTWLRRVAFDLTGLPPSPGDVEDFVRDQSAEAYERVVNRLLASPHYGERWARMWLDVARYAEDQAHIVGNDGSLTYPNAYLYRDWVIKAFNDDMPFDRFVKLQLAADLIEPESATNLPALGYIGLGPKYYQRNSAAVMADEWEDRVDIVGRGLLGITIACARCHDHKFDPIPTEDYYGLAGVFASTTMFNRPLGGKAVKESGNAKQQPKESLHIVREGTPTDLSVFIRGDVTNKGPIVARHFPQVLSEADAQPFHQGSGRLELAEAIASQRNPLTARVIVNRVWALCFGHPLVGTPSNFGSLGERPSHPELLDDLSVRFMDSGWSLKWLMRELVLSATYRQSAVSSQLAADPENRLLGRMSRRRLSVESWRDSVLAAAGTLDQTVGGASLNPQDIKERRRTIYSAISRLELNRMLAMFDFPDPNVHADRRVETTTPLQKMFVLNSPWMLAQATSLAGRLQTEIPGTDALADNRRIELAYQLLYSRAPTALEVRLGQDYLKDGDHQARWNQYAHVLLAANEMMYLD